MLTEQDTNLNKPSLALSDSASLKSSSNQSFNNSGTNNAFQKTDDKKGGNIVFNL